MQNYSELIDLAAKGNPESVDMYSNDVFQVDSACNDDASMYKLVSEMEVPTLMFSFGKTVGAKIGIIPYCVRLLIFSLYLLINSLLSPETRPPTMPLRPVF